jgi:hypothetical protein
MNVVSTDSIIFSKTVRVAIFAVVGEVERACKVAYTYGLETNPAVVAKFLKKIRLHARHAHIAPHTSTSNPSKYLIPLKAVTDALSRMPKQFVAHRDGWTWEIFRDAAIRPSTAALLRQFAGHFSNGALPKNLWTYLASP